MAKKQTNRSALSTLIKRCGGQEKFVELANAVLDDVGDTRPRLTLRAVKYWIAQNPPAHSPIWILAICVKAGLTVDEAIALYPDLASGHNLAMSIPEAAAA